MYVALAEHWNGATWTIDPTPIPAGAANSVLLGVSCPAADSCTAVGWYYGGALVEQWNGHAWSIQSTPASGATLLGVSCTTVTACTAVGRHANSSGTQVTLVERYSGEQGLRQGLDAPLRFRRYLCLVWL